MCVTRCGDASNIILHLHASLLFSFLASNLYLQCNKTSVKEDAPLNVTFTHAYSQNSVHLNSLKYLDIKKFDLTRRSKVIL